MSKIISYRPDIDGLRAIAVLLVILFHANFKSISGGYIGVDVFFVISGFLITSSINKEMLNQSFSFKSFYLRRIRRIIPVLVFVIVVVTIPASYFLFADDLEKYSRTVIHTMLSTNNFHLWIKGKNYFVENTELIPLLHTWSLSVEEQFYIIWPILLLLLHRFLSYKKRLIVVSIFILGGVFWSIYLTNTNMSMAYFLLPARFFELSMGAGLAMFWLKIPKLNGNVNHILSVLGIILIITPAVLLSKESAFPGLNAFWPCLGTTLLILTGKEVNSRGIANKIIETRFLVFIGLLSYSMYLWHWPILVFIKYLGFELTKPVAIAVIVVTILLSYFSWKYVEQPFRYTFKYNFSKTLLYVLLPCLLITGSIYGIIDHKNGFPDRFPNLTEFDKKTNFPSKLRKRCYGSYIIGNYDECGLGVKKNQLDGMLIGDSFANHSAAFLDVLAKDANMYFHDSAAGGYPLLYDVDDITGKPLQNISYGEERLKVAKQFKTICLAANWDRHYNKNSKNYQFVMSTLTELINLGKNVIVIDPLRATTEMNLHKMKMFKTNNRANISKKDLLIPFSKRPNEYIVYEMKRRFPAITVINLNDVMCSSVGCSYDVKGEIVYRNGNHLNTSGARLIAEKYLLEKGNPLKLIK